MRKFTPQEIKSGYAETICAGCGEAMPLRGEAALFCPRCGWELIQAGGRVADAKKANAAAKRKALREQPKMFDDAAYRQARARKRGA